MISFTAFCGFNDVSFFSKVADLALETTASALTDSSADLLLATPPSLEWPVDDAAKAPEDDADAEDAVDVDVAGPAE